MKLKSLVGAAFILERFYLNRNLISISIQEKKAIDAEGYREVTPKLTVDSSDETNLIPIERCIGHEDTFSPKLFIAALEDVFKNWKGNGVNINESS